MYYTHISVLAYGLTELGFLCPLVTEGIPAFSLLYPVKHSKLTKTNLPEGIWGKDDLSSLSSLKTESHSRSFRMKTALSRITCTKWPTSSPLSVP